jgi:hypothetical protein
LGTLPEADPERNEYKRLEGPYVAQMEQNGNGNYLTG